MEVARRRLQVHSAGNYNLVVIFRRRPSALAPKRSSTPEFSKDRDDRRKDIDERFSCIPLSCEVQESEKQRKIKDSFQEKLRETGKIRETIVQDNCMKFMVWQSRNSFLLRFSRFRTKDLSDRPQQKSQRLALNLLSMSITGISETKDCRLSQRLKTPNSRYLWFESQNPSQNRCDSQKRKYTSL